MPRCARCESAVPDSQKFCHECGAAITPSSDVGTVVMGTASAVRRARTSSSSPSEGRFPPGAVLAQRYRVSGKIGRGGMGEVYRAYDLILTQEVALKFLPGQLASEAALDRFRNEVRLARQVSHPNVCRVYDIGEVEGSPFLSMEFVDGEDLSSLLRRIGRLPSDKALDIARKLCAGLAAAHEKGVLHRDLKPGNIMVDGRGEVLITDFGLAALAGTVSAGEASQGTPAYMAPEQLSGREVTHKSDIYALGLVLYEMFTGRRAFEADSSAQLARMQQESTPPSVISIAKDVDPAVERAILRCLAPDPRNRPASAKSVGLALPGGDPLAAAIAAGETPSPEMVANAEGGEGLRPAVAAAVFASILIGLVALGLVAAAGSILDMTPFEYSPEALAGMARTHARDLGYSQRPGTSASGLETAANYLDYTRAHYQPSRFWAELAAGRPAPMTFWYRQSPGLLDPGPDQATVTMDRPASDVPGMYRMRLDLEGRLLSFEAVPPEFESAAPPAVAADWKPLFVAAGLDPARFQPAEPQWTPAMAFDVRAAWTGRWPVDSAVPIRVEAAAWRGKPVSFRIVEPWTSPARQQALPLDWLNLSWLLLEWFALFPVACFLAWRNLKLNRGDRAGAARLAVAIFCLQFPADLLQMSHVGGSPEALRLFYFFASDLTWAIFSVTLYLALEPHVRRRYPRLLVAWARLLQGGWREPLLAANVLAGLALGLYAQLLLTSEDFVKIKMGIMPGMSPGPWSPVLSARYFLGLVISGFPGATSFALLLLLLFFLLRLALRRDAVAGAAVVLISVAITSPLYTYPAMDIPVALVTWSALVFGLLRFGVPAGIAFSIAWTLPPSQILTLDPSKWYFGYSLAYFALLVVSAGFAFRFALGGRKLMRDETLG